MTGRRLLGVATVCVLLLLVAGRAGAESRLAVPANLIDGPIVWLDDGWIYFATPYHAVDLLGEPTGPDGLWRSRPGGGLQQVSLHMPAGCRRPERIGVLFRAGSSLGMNAVCGPSDLPAIVVVDPATGDGQLFSKAPYGVTGVAMSSDMSIAYLVIDSGDCSWLAEVDASGVRHATIAVGDPGHRFTVGAGSAHAGEGDTSLLRH